MRTAFAAAMLMLLAAAAFADPAPAAPEAPEAPAAPTSDCAKARAHGKTCVLDMGTETVDGNVAKNTGLDMTIATFGKHGSLIHIRKDFIAEILKTADDL